MTIAAAIVLATGCITPLAAWQSINWSIMAYLFAMFYLGSALEQSGLLTLLAEKLIERFHRTSSLLLFLTGFMGVITTILMNDTVAIIFTPLMVILSKKAKLPLTPLLLLLCFSITIGSIMSPVGNPQNLLIAMQGHIHKPLLVFLTHLALPSCLCLLVCFLMIKLKFRTHWPTHIDAHFSPTDCPHNPYLKRLSTLSLSLLTGLLLLKLIADCFLTITLPFSAIALISVLPLLCTKQQGEIFRRFDWQTLLFFLAMFIFTKSIWDSGVIQTGLQHTNINITHLSSIFGISILVSQLLSNVPTVALYLPLLQHASATTQHLMALAAGSTLAGNIFILGAASNVIVLESAEQRGHTGFSQWAFMRLGIPLTLICLGVFACLN